jgi:hypothetical protein
VSEHGDAHRQQAEEEPRNMDGPSTSRVGELSTAFTRYAPGQVQLELLGLLTMTVGVTTWGVSMVRGKIVPVRWAWLPRDRLVLGRVPDRVGERHDSSPLPGATR